MRNNEKYLASMVIASIPATVLNVHIFKKYGFRGSFKFANCMATMKAHPVATGIYLVALGAALYHQVQANRELLRSVNDEQLLFDSEREDLVFSDTEESFLTALVDNIDTTVCHEQAYFVHGRTIDECGSVLIDGKCTDAEYHVDYVYPDNQHELKPHQA